MRFFSRPARRRLLAVSMAAVLGLGVVQSQAAADGLKDKQKQVQKDISAAKDHLDESSEAAARTAKELASAQAQLAAAQAQLAQAQAEVTTAAAEDARMQAELVAAEARLAAAKAELAEGDAAVRVQQAQVASVVTDLYQNGDPQMMAVSALLDADSPADVIRTQQAREVMVDKETQVYADLRAAKVLLQVKRRQVAEAKEEVEVKRAAAASHLLQMQNLEAARQSATESVAALVTVRSDARRAARAAHRADREELAKLEAEANRIKEQLAAQAAAAGAGSSPVNSGGFLNPPVGGALRVTSPFGFRTHPIYGYYSLHDGTDFGVGCNQPLYATADGTVIQSYWSTPYGNRLILDHGVQRGVGVASIYNHAAKYVVPEGARVKRGQLIGYVGNTGWSTGCHLHFTVLVNGSPVDPMGWL